MTTPTDARAGALPWERRWPGGWPRHRTSIGLALVVAAIELVAVQVRVPGSHGGEVGGFGYALLLIGPAALIWRRISPLTTLAVALGSTYFYLVIGLPTAVYFMAAFIAIVTAASRARRVAVWAITAVWFLLVVGLATIGRDGYVLIYNVVIHGVTGSTAVVAGALTALALLMGEAVRSQRERIAEFRRAREHADRARGEQTRRQASDERLRIARELHDVLGHHLSLINVRAGVALHLLDSDKAQARDALSAIKLASAEALREVRTVLATLTPREEAAPRAPALGLDAIEDLAAEAEAAGTPVRITRTGDPRALPGEVERAAYRIVREALTNVRRHAGAGAMVTVTVGYSAEGLAVQVEDTGGGPAQSSTDADAGNGIAGMRERATALGGRLHTGPGKGGVGFVVEAFLPVEEGT
jgi:signal transduction histidine kinase